MTTFTTSVAASLQARTTELAARWHARACAATPRRVGVAESATEDDSARIVDAVVACLDRDARWQGEVMRLAWANGAAAQAAGLSAHHVLKDAELLLSILLTAAEEAAGDPDRARMPGAPAEAFAVARRLQRATGLYAQAAASSYLHATVNVLRAQWRLLRHDLRNPLGTIRSALSLMEDESLPPETRTGPRIRAMVARNAGSLESLIADRLDDRVAESMLAAPQEVSLRDVALAVRRSLREAIRVADCEVVVDDELPSAHVDEAAVELTLGTLLLAAVARAQPGDVLHVAHAPNAADAAARARRAGAGTVTLRIARHRAAGPNGDGSEDGAWDADGLALSTSLADEYGGRITAAASAAPTAAVELELPLLPNDEPVDGGETAMPAPKRWGEQAPRAD